MIGVEGTKTPPKMLRIFIVRGRIRGSLFNVLREQRDRRDPAGTKWRGGSGVDERKAKCLERKSTTKFNRAMSKGIKHENKAVPLGESPFWHSLVSLYIGNSKFLK
ncbi:hypothetical protein [Bacillus benzoevorans]|uniref:Uncharacterized protein n=1 Tax=Bacillus benzoevorans TaxID=1456 RepID=A0A7X0HPQ0_9BACI|nr:hypothetical protein [Bacillus benzoevorans]MBB6443492.1 hypothetical protein [Bacillus benzoevorans]